jgi:hypothetical protein
VPSRDLVGAFASKLFEEIDRIEHLAAMVRPEMLDISPLHGFSFRALLQHLLDCTGGFCAALDRALPGGLDHASVLKAALAKPVDQTADALERFVAFRSALRTGFSLLEDTDLARKLPTVFAAEGEPLLTILLSNYSHLVAHKYQLFMNLKASGVSVGTRDLYVFHDVE